MAVSSVKWIVLICLFTICISNAYGRGGGGRSSSRGSSRSSSRSSSSSSSRSSSGSSSGGSSSSSGVKSGVSSGSSNHGYGGYGGYNRGSGSYNRNRNSYGGYGSNDDENSNFQTYTVPPAPEIPSYERIPYRSHTYEYPRRTLPDYSDLEKWPKYNPPKFSSRVSVPDPMEKYANRPYAKVDGRIVTKREFFANPDMFSMEKMARGEIELIGQNTRYKRSTNL